MKSIEFLKDTVFKLQGTQTMGVVMLKRKLYGLVVEQDADFFAKQGMTPPQAKVDSELQQYILTILNDTPEKDKESARQQFQRKVMSSFFTITKDLDVSVKNNNLFTKYI